MSLIKKKKSSILLWAVKIRMISKMGSKCVKFGNLCYMIFGAPAAERDGYRVQSL